MTDTTRIDRIEAFLTSKFGYQPTDPVPAPAPPSPTPPVPIDGTIINDLNDIKSSGSYKLKSGTFTVTSSYHLPNDITVDLTNSVFNYTGPQWSGLFEFNEKSNNITVIGGSFKVAANSNNSIVNSSNANNLIFKNQVMLPNSYQGYRIAGGSNFTLDGFNATTWYAYCVFADTGAKNVVIKNWNINGGSENESCIRVHGVDGLIIQDSQVVANQNPVGAKKNVAMRLHEGNNFLVQNVKVKGLVGFGPMGGGDGGQQWGTTKWVGKNGEWYVAKEQADLQKTLDLRKSILALRTTKVRINNLDILDSDPAGGATCNPGLIDCIWDGGSITNLTNPPVAGWERSNFAFYSMAKEYPDGTPLYSVKLPNDITRPTPDITVNNINFNCYKVDPTGIVKVGKGNTLNGQAI